MRWPIKVIKFFISLTEVIASAKQQYHQKEKQINRADYTDSMRENQERENVFPTQKKTIKLSSDIIANCGDEKMWMIPINMLTICFLRRMFTWKLWSLMSRYGTLSILRCYLIKRLIKSKSIKCDIARNQSTFFQLKLESSVNWGALRVERERTEKNFSVNSYKL